MNIGRRWVFAVKCVDADVEFNISKASAEGAKADAVVPDDRESAVE